MFGTDLTPGIVGASLARRLQRSEPIATLTHKGQNDKARVRMRTSKSRSSSTRQEQKRQQKIPIHANTISVAAHHRAMH